MVTDSRVSASSGISGVSASSSVRRGAHASGGDHVCWSASRPTATGSSSEAVRPRNSAAVRTGTLGRWGPA
ncbi:MAG: hypothetical protein PGN11_14530 [Quadrisphaera sp.]